MKWLVAVITRYEAFDPLCTHAVFFAAVLTSTLSLSICQVAMGFMVMGSGLAEHEVDSASPLPYTHMDIVGSAGPFPGIPTGTPIPALTKHFVMPRI